MSTVASNVRVVSNIYPVAAGYITVRSPLPPFTERRIDGVCDDPNFRTRIRGHAALVKLCQLKCGALIDHRHARAALLDNNLVEPWQIRVYWDQEGDGRCVDCDPGERPFGIVKHGSTTAVECRCQKRNCPARRQTHP